MGLRRERSGQLVDRYGRPMEVDWDKFKKKRGKVQNPVHASVKKAEEVVERLLGEDDMDEYTDLVAALDPQSYSHQRTLPHGSRSRSINYEWEKEVPSWASAFKPLWLAIRFTITTTLRDDLTSTVTPIIPMALINNFNSDNSKIGDTHAFTADGAGTQDMSHMIKIYKAIQQIEQEVLPRHFETPAEYVDAMDKILYRYEDPNRI